MRLLANIAPRYADPTRKAAGAWQGHGVTGAWDGWRGR